MENKKDNYSTNFIKFGTFSAEEVNILKLELEKRGIPVKVVYPGMNVGTAATANMRWTAYTIMIREIDIKTALGICNTLNIKAEYKIPLPKLLYTRTNRCILGVIIAICLAFIILEKLGILQNEMFVGVLIGTLFLTILLFLVITSHKIITKR